MSRKVHIGLEQYTKFCEVRMFSDLLVRMKIPLDPMMVFTEWFPLEEQEHLSIVEGNLHLKYWFDLACARIDDESEISRHQNISAHTILVDVRISGLSQILLGHILSRDTSKSPDPEESQEAEEYERVGKRVYVTTLTHLNRLISFVRATPGQYWLKEYDINPNIMLSDFTKFHTMATVDLKDWFIWNPTHRILLTASMPTTTRYLNSSNWADAIEFAISNRKNPLKWELLAGADYLASIDQSRSALTEAVTALEVSLHEFAQHINVDMLLSPELKMRLGITSLHKLVNRLGLHASINYLLPIIFDHEKIPTELLRDCQDAVDDRGNIVHHGQREVSEENLTRYLNAIRRICTVLEEYQLH